MNIKILLIDDDEVTRILLKEVLEREGYTVQLASTGEEAVHYLYHHSYPIIISDIRMVEMDGMAVLREVKKKSARSAVILMTGFGSMEGAIEAIQEGAFDYISKPFQMTEFKTVVARATKHWESIQQESLQNRLHLLHTKPLDLLCNSIYQQHNYLFLILVLVYQR